MSSTNHNSITTVPTLCIHHGIGEQLLSVDVDVDRLFRDLLDHRTILSHPLLREAVLGKTLASDIKEGIGLGSRSHHYPRHDPDHDFRYDPHVVHHHLESVKRGRAG